MTVFDRAHDLRAAEFRGVDLRGARFVESDLSGAVMRAVDVADADIDAPWLAEGDPFLVNGVDVVPLVEAELNRRFDGRSKRRAEDPEGLRSAWEAVRAAWSAACARVATMPPGTADVSVAGEWSFSQTLRHLVMGTDLWLGGAVLEAEQPLHPLGLPPSDVSAECHLDLSRLTSRTPSYDEVLEARADRVGMVGDFLDGVTDEELDVLRRNPWAPSQVRTTLSCLHVILGEEWEHLRFATRDLDALERETVA